jgi:hypothetical protein
MVVSFAQEDSFASAVSKTFDGKHPCKLCRLVEAGRSADQTPDEIVRVTKLEGCEPVRFMTLRPASSSTELPPWVIESWSPRNESPRLTPPRVTLL